MMAFALRDAKPLSKNYNQLDEVEKEKAQEKFKAECLTNMLKGAGPLLQKILQGMPAATENSAFSTALKDMKSNLAPIPEELVQEQLFGIVQRSRGNISEIKVERALGAASVGQAFLCKIFGPHLPKEGKKVVVKILRPDVRNRMAREKSVLLNAAKQTDENGGMLATYQGQLKRIEEELDLSIEADNVELGKVYDKTYKTVKSMKVSNLVDPTANVLVLEQAEGETVDRYMESVTQEHAKLIERFTKTGNTDFLQITLENGHDLAETRERLVAMLQQLQKRQEHMRNLAEMWVTEGIYGEGFYHGDLHAGNIIINDEGLTVIDFGNATKLTQDQQSNIIRMMAAAAVGDVKTFRHGFHMLLEKTDPKFYASKRAEFTKILEEIFSLGTKENAGQRIGAALIKAQELGLELPSSISNFSQCQLRLQNAMTSMNDEIEKLQKDIEKLDTADTMSGHGDPLIMHLLSADTGKTESSFRKFLDSKLDEWGDLDEEKFNYMAQSKQQQSIDAYEEIQSEMKMAISGAETVQDGFAQAMVFAGKKEKKATYDATVKAGAKIATEWLDKAYYYVDQDNEQEMEEYTAMRTKLEMYIQKPEENLDGIKEEATKLTNFFKMKKAALDNLRDAQNNPDTSSVEMEKRLKAAYTVANAVKVSKNIENNDAEAFGGVLVFAQENVDNVMDQMKNWTKHHGELGRAVEKSYEEYVQAHESKSADANAKWLVFKLKYREMMLRELKAMRKAYNVRQRSLSATPDSFYDVMGSVIESNKAVTFKHLGTYNTISYYFKM